jgi:peroxin-6
MGCYTIGFTLFRGLLRYCKAKRQVNCYDIISESDSKTEAYLRHRIDRANSYRPCLLLLRHIDAFAKKRDVLEQGQDPSIRFVLSDCLAHAQEDAAGKEWPLIVVGTTSEREKCSEGVAGIFKHEIEIAVCSQRYNLIQAPSEVERRNILTTLTTPLPLMQDVSMQTLAVRTAALVPMHLIDLCIRAESAAQDRYEQYSSNANISMLDLDIAGVGVNMADFDQALSEVRGNFSDSIGAPKIPNVGWDDVGGLADVKNDILDTIQLPLEHPELFAKGMKKRSGSFPYCQFLL